jgi:hypothetical protein
VDGRTGDRLDWGRYKPLDFDRVKEIQGRLGDLLHPRVGLSLGVWNDPWYGSTRAFLVQTEAYLGQTLQGHTPFFAYEGLDNIEVTRDE